MLQTILARRIVRATWRLERADRIEAEMLENRMQGEDDLGLALIRDGNSSRSFDTLLRYRGGALAELFRALRTLKALQAEGAAQAGHAGSAVTSPEQPNEPERPTDPGEPGSRRADEVGPGRLRLGAPPRRARTARVAPRNEPESLTEAGLAPPADDPRRAA